MEGSLFNPGVLGTQFTWWIGQVMENKYWEENTIAGKHNFGLRGRYPGWGYRYKVRIMGVHDQSDADLPSEDLPWAQIMYPVTAGDGRGNIQFTSALTPGTYVFGFWLDGADQQVPLIMGILGNNKQTPLSMDSAKKYSPFSFFANPEGKKASDSVLSTEKPKEENVAPTVESNDDVQVKTIADTKKQTILEKKRVIPCVDPKSNTDVLGINTAVENLQKQLKDFDESLQDYAKAAALPIKNALKDIDKVIEDAAKLIAMGMAGILLKIKDFVVDMYNKTLAPLLKNAFPTDGLKLSKLKKAGLEKIICMFNALMKGLASLAAGALRNGIADGSIQTSTPPEGYYNPSPECTTEKLIAEMLGTHVNTIMQGYSNAIGPVITSAGGDAGSSGNPLLERAITLGNVITAYENGTLITALAGAIAQSAGVNVNNIGTVVNAFKNGNYMTGINDIAGRLGVETSPGITLAASLIDRKEYVSGFAAAASALGADPDLMGGIGGAVGAIEDGEFSALKTAVAAIAGSNPGIFDAVSNAGSSSSGGGIGDLLGQGGLSGLPFDIGAAMTFLSVIDEFFACDAKYKCAVSKIHTLEKGGSGSKSDSQTSAASVAQQVNVETAVRSTIGDTAIPGDIGYRKPRIGGLLGGV